VLLNAALCVFSFSDLRKNQFGVAAISSIGVGASYVGPWKKYQIFGELKWKGCESCGGAIQLLRHVEAKR
jgi:hypothetical protein